MKLSLLSLEEKKLLYVFACPNHHNTVTRLKLLTTLAVDPEAKRRTLELARKVETEIGEDWHQHSTCIFAGKWTSMMRPNAGCVW